MVLSASNSLKSTNKPLQAFSTTFPGIGARAGDIIMGAACGVSAEATTEGNLIASDGRQDSNVASYVPAGQQCGQ